MYDTFPPGYNCADFTVAWDDDGRNSFHGLAVEKFTLSFFNYFYAPPPKKKEKKKEEKY